MLELGSHFTFITQAVCLAGQREATSRSIVDHFVVDDLWKGIDGSNLSICPMRVVDLAVHKESACLGELIESKGILGLEKMGLDDANVAALVANVDNFFKGTAVKLRDDRSQSNRAGEPIKTQNTVRSNQRQFADKRVDNYLVSLVDTDVMHVVKLTI